MGLPLHNQITGHLSPPEILTQHRAGVRTEGAILKYARIWTAIFKNMDWLDESVRAGAQPVLVGHGLQKDIKTGQSGVQSGSEIHIFLLSMDWHGDSSYISPKILDCLQDHDLDRSHNAHIRGTNITVNICDVSDLCFNLVGARDHSRYQRVDQLVSDGVTAILPYLDPKEVQVLPIRPEPSSSDVVIRFEFTRYRLKHPDTADTLEWLFVSEDADRAGEEDHERYVGPENGRAFALDIARRVPVVVNLSM